MKRYIWVITVLLILTLALTNCASPGLWTSPSPAAAPSPGASQSGPLPASIAAIEETLESIYAQVNTSVVNIQVLQQVTTPSFPSIPGFPEFPGLPPTPQPQQQFSRALGSGFVWDMEGRLVTNNHVVDGADRITVTFHDGTVVPATVVGTDPDSDLAVIKVDVAVQELQPVKMADSTQLKVGQLAIAIGNPFGLQGTMTVGFVSALGRLLPANESAPGPTYTIPDVIQTDAALNPGNSGGVLLNDVGMVIGVTSAIATTGGTSAGVGFAIPSAIVQKVVPELIRTGHYDHPWLGISIVSLNPDLAGAMGLKPDQRGALVVDVAANGPADKAGLHVSQKQVTINGQQARVGGDVIIALNGQPLKSSDDLVTYLARSGSVGQTVSLTVLRDGKEAQLQITLEARPRT